MNTAVTKKTPLLAVIAAAMMVFCAFAVTVPTDGTSAADSETTDEDEGIDIDFSRLDMQKMTGLYAVSSIETPLKTSPSYSDADAVIVGGDGAETVNVSDLLKKVEGKTVLVVKNGSTVVFDKIDDKEYNEVDIGRLVIENGAVFDATALDSGTGDLGNLGIIKTGTVAVDGVTIATLDSLLIKGKVTVSTLEKGETETLHIAFDISDSEGGLTFSSNVEDGGKTYQWNLTIGGGYDRSTVSHAAEYRVTFDSSKTYADTYGNLTLSTLKGIVKQDAESVVGDYDISLEIADLEGAVRTGNDPEPPEGAETGETPSAAEGETPAEPAPEYSAKFGATAVALTMKNTNGIDEETQKATHACDIHYQVGTYTYKDADKEKDSAVEVTFTGLSMNLKADQSAIKDASANFSTLRGYSKDEDGSNTLTAERFSIGFTDIGIRGDCGFANAVTSIIKEGKITKENVGKIADNLVGFTMDFSADSFRYLSPAAEETSAAAESESEDDPEGMKIALTDAAFHAAVDDKGILTFTSGVPNTKFALADTADIVIDTGAIVYKIHSDYLILNMENVSVAKVLKYVVNGGIGSAVEDGFANVISDVMTKQILDGVKITLKCDIITVGFSKTSDGVSKNVVVQLGSKLDMSTVILGFTGTAMELDADLDELKIGDNVTGTEKNGGSSLTLSKVAFGIGFEPQGITEFGKLIQKSASPDFGFADVLAYYRTALSADKATSWSSESKPFTLCGLDYGIKYSGSDEDYYTDIHVSLAASDGTSGDSALFTMGHGRDKNELSAEFVNGSVLSYSSYVADGLDPVGTSTEIKDFRLAGLNKTGLDDGSKVVSFTIVNLGASSPETEQIDSHAYFVSLKNAGPKLSVRDIEEITEDEIPLWKTAMAAEPEEYFVAEGYHGDMESQKDTETGIDYPKSISYGHFGKDLCIAYKLAGKEKVALIPDTVSDKDQTVAVFSVAEDGSFIIDTEGTEQEGQSIKFILRAGVLSDVAEVPATCTADGTLAHKHCTVCEKNYIGGEEKTDAQMVVPALGHTAVPDAAVPATKENEGLTAGSHCAVCKEVLVAQEKIAKLPADAVKTVIDAAEGTVEVGENGIRSVIDGGLALEVKNGDVSAELSAEVLGYLSETYGGSFRLDIEKVADTSSIDNEAVRNAVKDSGAVISVSLLMNGKEEHQLGSSAVVSLDYVLPSDRKASDMYVAYVDDSGNLTAIGSTYEDGVLSFETDHFSYYAVMYGAEGDGEPGTAISIAAVFAAVLVLIIASALGWKIAGRKA